MGAAAMPEWLPFGYVLLQIVEQIIKLLWNAKGVDFSYGFVTSSFTLYDATIPKLAVPKCSHSRIYASR
jgi:hypothetical protein